MRQSQRICLGTAVMFIATYLAFAVPYYMPIGDNTLYMSPLLALVVALLMTVFMNTKD